MNRHAKTASPLGGVNSGFSILKKISIVWYSFTDYADFSMSVMAVDSENSPIQIHAIRMKCIFCSVLSYKSEDLVNIDGNFFFGSDQFFQQTL